MSSKFDHILAVAAADVLHDTVNQLHADYATKLAQAGHAVTADDHADALVAAAQPHFAQPGQPPTYADHANAAFAIGMTHALLQFAAHFLPAKFQPVVQAVEGAEGEPTQGSLLDSALDVAQTAAAVLAPGAAPVLAAAAAVVQAVESSGGEASPDTDGGPGKPPEPEDLSSGVPPIEGE